MEIVKRIWAGIYRFIHGRPWSILSMRITGVWGDTARVELISMIARTREKHNSNREKLLGKIT
jgi:hypothetical protein